MQELNSRSYEEKVRSKVSEKGALVIRNLAEYRKVEPAIEDKQVRKTMRKQIKKGMQDFAKGKGSIKELKKGTSDPTIKATIQNLFSSSKQVSLTKTNLPIIYSLLIDFCEDNAKSTGINKNERVDRTGNNDVSMCSKVSELTQMTGVGQDMEIDSTAEEGEDLP
eukprot:7373909-Ditylum_brightwellii.AAC.1